MWQSFHVTSWISSQGFRITSNYHQYCCTGVSEKYNKVVSVKFLWLYILSHYQWRCIIGRFGPLKTSHSLSQATKPWAITYWLASQPLSVEFVNFKTFGPSLYKLGYFGIQPMKIDFTVTAVSICLFNVFEFFSPIKMNLCSNFNEDINHFKSC